MSNFIHGKPVAPRLHFAAPYIKGFTRWLRANGYAESSTVETTHLLAGWADWMHRRCFGLDTILAGLAALACGVYCVVPFALPAAALAVEGGLRHGSGICLLGPPVSR